MSEHVHLWRLDGGCDYIGCDAMRVDTPDQSTDLGTLAEHEERAMAAEQALQRVRELCNASDDGSEYEHTAHPEPWGEPECPGCWVDAIRRALDGAP